MSLDASVLPFFESIRLDGGPRPWVEQQLLSELPDITADAPWPGAPTGCLIADIGNYLVRLLHILATFAQSLLSKDLISAHIDEKIQDLVAEDDLHTANLLDDKHAALKQVADKLKQALKDCEHSWSFTLSSPPSAEPFQELHGTEYPIAHQPSEALYADHHSRSLSHMNVVGFSPPNQQSSSGDLDPFEGVSFPSTSDRGATENSVPNDNHFYAASSSGMEASDSVSPSDTSESVPGAPLLEQLKSRGKGQYTCPHEKDCKKGGVQPNGELTVFERNSAFRSHLQLHERVFKCDIPGCTNKKGFARIDQLERHKKTVRHNAPGTIYEVHHSQT